MATYENAQPRKKRHQSVIEANTASQSFAFSNDIYGALMLEATIPSTVTVTTTFDDLDDFWLDLAKGQTLKQTSKEASPGNVFENSGIPQPSLNFPKCDLPVNDGFILETDWRYCKGNNKDENTFFSEGQSKITSTSGESVHLQVDDSSNGINQTNILQDSAEDPNALYSLARHCSETDSSVENNEQRSNVLHGANYKEEHSRKYQTIPGYSVVPDFSNVYNFKTRSLGTGSKITSNLTTLQDSQLYDSVDNLTSREKMPLPVQSRLEFVEIQNDAGFSSNIDNEPIYAKIIKTNSNPPMEMENKSTENDEFYSLASARLDERRSSSDSIKSLGLDYPYSKVFKPKRYENWPVKGFSGKQSNKNTQPPCSDFALREVDPEEYYSTVDDARAFAAFNNTLPEASIDSKNKNMCSSFHNTVSRSKSFNPFTFVFNFQVKTENMESAPVKSILPYKDGKCWLACEHDLKIRLFDSQGQESESIHIGLEVIDMTFNSACGHLYVSCKDSKTIYNIDTRNLCMISSFVNADCFPCGLEFDSIGDTLIVCENEQDSLGVPEDLAPAETLKKYLVKNPDNRRNLTTEKLFSHPQKVLKSANSDIIVSDSERSSLTILQRNGKMKSRFTGSNGFSMGHNISFVCDLQSNIFVFSKGKQEPKAFDNMCLLGENGELISTFNLDEVNDQIVHVITLSDFGFLWVGSNQGVFVFDYQI